MMPLPPCFLIQMRGADFAARRQLRLLMLYFCACFDVAI